MTPANKTINNFGTINVRQTGYSFPFSLPSYKKEGRKKEEEIAKPVLNHFFVIVIQLTK